MRTEAEVREAAEVLAEFLPRIELVRDPAMRELCLRRVEGILAGLCWAMSVRQPAVEELLAGLAAERREAEARAAQRN